MTKKKINIKSILKEWSFREYSYIREENIDYEICRKINIWYMVNISLQRITNKF